MPLLAGTIAITVLLGPEAAADATPRSLPSDLSEHARTLCDQYFQGQGVSRLRMPTGATLDDTEIDLAACCPGRRARRVQVGGAAAAQPSDDARAGDVVIVRATRTQIVALAAATVLAATRRARPYRPCSAAAPA